MINCIIKKELPALLSKKKTVFISPVWNERMTCFWCNKKFEDLIEHTKNKYSNLSARSYDNQEIKPSAKKNQIEDVFWNKDSEYEWFCPKCLEGGIDYSANRDVERFSLRDFNLPYDMQTTETKKALLEECPITEISSCGCNKSPFPKNIGKVKLTEDEFQIEILKQDNIKNAFRIMTFGTSILEDKNEFKYGDLHFCPECKGDNKLDFFKDLGYNSAEEFFKEMDKIYDLSNPKKFNVKVGEWIK